MGGRSSAIEQVMESAPSTGEDHGAAPEQITAKEFESVYDELSDGATVNIDEPPPAPSADEPLPEPLKRPSSFLFEKDKHQQGHRELGKRLGELINEELLHSAGDADLARGRAARRLAAFLERRSWFHGGYLEAAFKGGALGPIDSAYDFASTLIGGTLWRAIGGVGIIVGRRIKAALRATIEAATEVAGVAMERIKGIVGGGPTPDGGEGELSSSLETQQGTTEGVRCLVHWGMGYSNSCDPSAGASLPFAFIAVDYCLSTTTTTRCRSAFVYLRSSCLFAGSSYFFIELFVALAKNTTSY